MKTAIGLFFALLGAIALAQIGGGGITGGGGGGTSGTWTGVASNNNNMDSVTPSLGQYTVVGSVVTYSFAIAMDVTSSGSSSDTHVTLPVSTTATSSFNNAGVCSPGSGTQTSGANISYESPGFHIAFTSTDTSGHTWYCSGSYRTQ